MVSPRGEERDYVAKRGVSHRFGVLQSRIFDPFRCTLIVLTRDGAIGDESEFHEATNYETELTTGHVVSVGKILGPIDGDSDDADDQESI